MLNGHCCPLFSRSEAHDSGSCPYRRKVIRPYHNKNKPLQKEIIARAYLIYCKGQWNYTSLINSIPFLIASSFIGIK